MKDLKSFIDIWKKFMYILSPSQKRWGIVVFFISLIGSFLEMLGVSIMLPLMQAMISPQELRTNSVISSFCDYFKLETDKEILIAITILVMLVYLFKNLYLTFSVFVRVKYSNKINREMSINILDSYMQRGYNFFRLTNSAVLLRGTSESVAHVQTVIYSFFKIISEGLTILSILIYMAITDIEMVIAMLLIALICMIIVLLGFRGVVRRSGDKYFTAYSEAHKWILQLFNGIKEILVMRRGYYFVNNYEREMNKRLDANTTRTIAIESPAYLIEAFCVIGLIGAVCSKILHMDNPTGYIAQLASFAVAAFRILPSMGRISCDINTMLFSLPGVNETYSNMKEAKQFATILGNLEIDNNMVENDSFINKYHMKDKLEISDVVFHYSDSEKNVINHVSLTINKGESVAFIGPSGSGKSTLADIVLGLIIPQNGEVLVDEMEIMKNKKLWSEIVGFVPQNPYLIDDSVRRNIAFGIPDENIDDDRVCCALKQAQIFDFVNNLEAGINTIVGDKGVRFSGGQAQRLAIARALYNNPDILIMDEATSALDSDTETAVMEAIDGLHGQITMIIIAHRISTIKNCDRIFEVKDGFLSQKVYSELL